jgi:hypothetical protein
MVAIPAGSVNVSRAPGRRLPTYDGAAKAPARAPQGGHQATS